MQLNLLPTIQQAISNLLTVYEPEFLRFGYGLFLSFATIIICWQGVRMMFSHDGLGEQMFDFAKLLLFVAFGYAMITFYEAPIPGFGVSFSNLITDQTFYFQSVLEARSFDNIYRHLDELADHFMQPDAWSILANLLYWTVLLLVAVAKALSLAVIAFGLIASAVCALLGPIFVPFFIVKQAGLALLGMVEVLHPVLVHSRGGDRLSDGLRAVRVQVRDDAASDHHASGVRHLCPAGSRGPGNVLRGHPARAIADQLDLLGTRW